MTFRLRRSEDRRLRRQIDSALNALNTKTDHTGLGDHYFDSLVLGATPGGISIGNATADAYGWADIEGPIEVRGVAATDPAWAVVNGGPFYAYKFDIGDYVFVSYHVPHDIVPSTDIHIHCHWFPGGTNTNTVKWEWYYTFAKGFNQEAFSTTGTQITAEQAGPGTAWQHMVTETAAITISGLTEPDGYILTRLRRVTNGGTDNTDDIFVITSDIHYQSTGLVSTANKAPNFYTLP